MSDLIQDLIWGAEDWEGRDGRDYYNPDLLRQAAKELSKLKARIAELEAANEYD